MKTDDVLIRLHRQYSKDEYVTALNKELSEKNIEIGKYKSFIDELEFENLNKDKSIESWERKYNRLKDKYDTLLNGNRKDELVVRHNKLNKKLQLEIQSKILTIRDLVSTNLMLKSQIESFNQEIQ